MAPMRALLITGQPSSGKTTLIKRLMELAPAISELPISGFVTDEVLAGGSRVGFDVVSVGVTPVRRGPLARKGMKSSAKTGAYGVDVEGFERIALPLLSEGGGGEGGGSRIVIIDEIGRMEMHCPGFEATVRRLLETDGVLLIGSVAAPRYGHVVPLAEEIKARSDVMTLHLKPSTRDEVTAEAEKQIRQLLTAGGAKDGGCAKQQRQRQEKETKTTAESIDGAATSAQKRMRL